MHLCGVICLFLGILTSDRVPTPEHRAGKFIVVPYRNVGEQKGLRYKPHPSLGTAHRSWKPEGITQPAGPSAGCPVLLGEVFSTFLTP